MSKFHFNGTTIWEEWHGIGSFELGLIVGGVASLEKKYGNRWRRDMSGGEQKRFSRLKLTVKHITAVVDLTKKPASEMLVEIDNLLNDVGARDVTTIESTVREYADELGKHEVGYNRRKRRRKRKV